MPKIKKIVLVDDDIDDGDIFIEAISHIDSEIECRHFKNGQDILNLIKEDNFEIPDLIFLDLNMPIISGMEFLNELRAIKHLHQIPIVISSTSSADRDMETAIEAGAQGYITKSTSFEAFKSNLADWIKRFS